jgi:outer membrane biosynthesis protein TonB
MIYALTLILLAAAAPDAPRTCDDPAFAALFTPLRPHLGRYEVCTTPTPLDEREGEALEALDAFGAAGTYDRAKLARLYGGTRARVVRTWAENGSEIVSITRISPYPDPAMSRLISGTLEIRFIVSRGL